MNDVPIIRKGSFKDYLSDGFGDGAITGIMFFLFSLVYNPLLTSIWIGIVVWIGIILLFIGIGFPTEEYYKRKKRIKKLNSDKYIFLHDNNFTMHPDLYLEGFYRDFWFRVLPMTKWEKYKKDFEYDIIQAFYNLNAEEERYEEERMSGDYFLGKLIFENHCAGFIPKDWQQPDFKANFDGLISIFKREGLMPLLKSDWEERYGKKLIETSMNEEKSRTKQILKIGNLDIKYIKPAKKEL
ncbi:MAG: hypothetical protein P1P88_20715 [Bacteroidales bacterium]|nr:hypothetical protein [Bacteroidales bacterium]